MRWHYPIAFSLLTLVAGFFLGLNVAGSQDQTQGFQASLDPSTTDNQHDAELLAVVLEIEQRQQRIVEALDQLQGRVGTSVGALPAQEQSSYVRPADSYAEQPRSRESTPSIQAQFDYTEFDTQKTTEMEAKLNTVLQNQDVFEIISKRVECTNLACKLTLTLNEQIDDIAIPNLLSQLDPPPETFITQRADTHGGQTTTTVYLP